MVNMVVGSLLECFVDIPEQDNFLVNGVSYVVY